MEEYIWLVGSALAEMRLTVEGTVALYGEIMSSLYQRAKEEGQAADAANLDTVEGALRTLQNRIAELQLAYQKLAMDQK